MNAEVFSAPCAEAAHCPIGGRADIHHGVTIDVRSIDGIEVRPDDNVTFSGGGAVWRDVCQKLGAMGLMVPGGRGIECWCWWPGSGRVNYEVVLADGRIVNANATEIADLWLSLRGGSRDFGIVTRFDIRTFSQGNIWGGVIRNDISMAPQQLEAFTNFNGGENFGEYVALIRNFVFVGDTGLYNVVNNLECTKPLAYPPVFQSFTAIQPQLSNSMHIASLADMRDEIAASSPRGARWIFMTTTFWSDLHLRTSVFDLWKMSTSKIAKVAGIVYTLTIQALPSSITSKSGSLDGNSLGSEPSDGPLV